jgi:hypothetical protein
LLPEAYSVTHFKKLRGSCCGCGEEISQKASIKVCYQIFVSVAVAYNPSRDRKGKLDGLKTKPIECQWEDIAKALPRTLDLFVRVPHIVGVGLNTNPKWQLLLLDEYNLPEIPELSDDEDMEVDEEISRLAAEAAHERKKRKVHRDSAWASTFLFPDYLFNVPQNPLLRTCLHSVERVC